MTSRKRRKLEEDACANLSDADLMVMARQEYGSRKPSFTPSGKVTLLVSISMDEGDGGIITQIHEPKPNGVLAHAFGAGLSYWIQTQREKGLPYPECMTWTLAEVGMMCAADQELRDQSARDNN